MIFKDTRLDKNQQNEYRQEGNKYYNHGKFQFIKMKGNILGHNNVSRIKLRWNEFWWYKYYKFSKYYIEYNSSQKDKEKKPENINILGSQMIHDKRAPQETI